MDLLYYLTFPSFSLMTLSTLCMNFLVSFSSHSPSLNDIWFRDMTSNDRFEIVLRRFLLKAKANSPLAALFTLIISSVYPILVLRMSMILWYCSWILVISCWVSFLTVFSYPSLYVNLNKESYTFSKGKKLSCKGFFCRLCPFSGQVIFHFVFIYDFRQAISILF